MSGGPEYNQVELPFIDQLIALGWKYIGGSVDHPTVTGRSSFRDVLLEHDLRHVLRSINLRNNKPWLDDARIAQAIGALTRIAAPRLIEANQAATALLLEGHPVDGLPDWDGGRQQTIHYIDWHEPKNNTFTVINQFRVDCPRGQAVPYIILDLVLFINGIPVVVVECKSRQAPEAIPAAVDQLRRYQNQRKADGHVQENEGNERLFFTNQILVATCFDDARAGTIGADLEHYIAWKDTAPIPLADVAKALHTADPAKLPLQQKLIAGMLRPAHLLDIIRHFTLYQEVSGRTVKVVCRYQQFRAVHGAIDRLLHGKTRKEDGEHDERGGIIWHTQGSGKSLTMVFLVRKLRSLPALRRFKVVVITDRKDLQRQLSGTAALTGETVKVASKVAELKKLLGKKGPGIVFAMIQKYAGRDDDNPAAQAAAAQDFEELNADESILVLVDEAHRSHTNTMHANLQKALPNAARIGFTGTPILMGAKKRTHEIFGPFIDRYRLRESEADGATVPILYEGRTASGAVSDGRDLDQLFEDMFVERTPEELEAIKRKYATKGNVLEAERMIEAKARDMLRHYVEHILPSGLKAQIAAYSRLAAVRYVKALREARDELVEEAKALDPALRDLDVEALATKPRKLRVAVRAYQKLADLERLEFAAVISGVHNEDPMYGEWTDEGKIVARIARFVKPLVHEDPEKADPLAFLAVKSMLLTGFDAPIEGVMYLDRPIREAELLQAIARVNRTGHGKQAGIIVDYYGVAQHLTEALATYSAEDVEGVLRNLRDEIPKLRDRHQRVLDFFKGHGVANIFDTEACVQLLTNERLRAEFTVKLKQFLDTLDLVLPRPEGLPYLKDAKQLGLIYTEARTLLRGELPELAKSTGAKVRRLIDEHVISLGVDPKIAPIAITDAGFAAHVGRQVSPRAKASEMEHALRHHIRQNRDADPVLYQRLSERLEEILKAHGDDWEQLALALRSLSEEAEKGRQKDDTGLDTQTETPFFAVLKEERAKDRPVPPADARWLAGLTVQLVTHIRAEIRVVDFWKNTHAREVLRGVVFTFLDDHEIVSFEQADAVADRIMELAKANHARLVKP
ncbi:type I restriction endonuclease subunit R [Sorangium sp. So ce1151]|uniref:type I restriction endonuclease subunit R n=1 Tax=Sorangium sp. So ce1151 TaxID=3133332 RepID=UPI003F61FDE3